MIICPNRPRYTIDRSDPPEPHRRQHNEFGWKLKMRPDLLSGHLTEGRCRQGCTMAALSPSSAPTPLSLQYDPERLPSAATTTSSLEKELLCSRGVAIENLCSIRAPRPDELDAFVERLVPELQRFPELQRCGIFLREHEGAPFYEHLDLPRRPNRFHPMEASRQSAAEQGAGACRWVGLCVAPRRGS
jgi:hypothetical protein